MNRAPFDERVQHGVHMLSLLQLTFCLVLATQALAECEPRRWPIAQTVELANWRSSGINLRAGDVDGDGWTDVAVGLPDGDRSAPSQAGGVQLFHGGPVGLEAPARWTVTGTVRRERVGASLGLGDFDADGRLDLLVGSGQDILSAPPHADVYWGSASGFGSTPGWSQPPDLGHGDFLAVTDAGDVNGDGIDDFVVLDDVTATGERAIVTFFGDPSGPVRGGALVHPSSPWIQVRRGGDVDGDGFDDLLAEADDLLLVLPGSPGGPVGVPLNSFALAGVPWRQVEPLGDLNQDGYDDAAIGFPGDVTLPVHLHYGSPSGLTSAVALPLPPDADGVGRAVVAGDLDADGWPDVVVSGHVVRERLSLACIFAWFGSSSGFTDLPRLLQHADPAVPFPRAGSELAALGDMNGDGLADVVVGGTVLDVLHGQVSNRAPGLVPLGEVTAECGTARIRLGATDPDGDELIASWSTTCPGVLTPSADGLEAEIRTGDACFGACEVEVTVEDGHCGVASASARVLATDGTPPSLVALPTDGRVSCEHVPPVPPVHVLDDCSPTLEATFGEIRIDGPCGWSYDLMRTWEAIDDCGNAVTASVRVEVRDVEPPVLEDSDRVLACAWPPNGRWERFTLSEWPRPAALDCDPAPRIDLVGCVVHEAGIPDAELAAECLVAADQLLVRVRRSGTSSGGRTIEVLVRATDACGNVSAPRALGRVLVPHDRRTESTCR